MKRTLRQECGKNRGENKPVLNAELREKYNTWLENATEDNLIEELKSMNEAEIEDSFYRDLAFGTGGLRGVIGAGTNRMNVYTVGKASQGLANYLNNKYNNPSIAISYDSRIKSDLFSKVAAGVFAANGIHVFIYPQLMPTPLLSYAVRYLGCSAGVMVTASHNPSKYNGYKVYGADGCQITTEAAGEILTEIEKVDVFKDVRWGGQDIEEIKDEVWTSFTEEIKKQSPVKGEDFDRSVRIVYTPLNGTGLKPVTRVLEETGYKNITIVREQEQPDGNFPTCPYPNPEIREAMELGIRYAEANDAELLLATDPDCDRCGIAVKDGDEYRLLSGNETGLLLFDWICERRIANGTMPKNPVLVKTIVTSDMGEQIADHYGVKTINVLTGFKFIGEQIGLLEKQGREDDYIFGFEESYGYLSGSYVRDKDAVDAAFLICEMFAWYKSKGISLCEKLDELYREYGYRLNTLHSYTFEGSAGFELMKGIMQKFRGQVDFGRKIEKVLDYKDGLDGLPKSDVLKFILEGGSVVVRPSGTEPKLKVYISISAESMEAAKAEEEKISKRIEEYMK